MTLICPIFPEASATVNPVGTPFLSVPAKIDLVTFAFMVDSVVNSFEFEVELLTELSLAVVEEAMTVDAINVDLDENTDEWISLKAFLKLKRLNDKEKKDMKRRFKAIAKWGDKRLSVRDDKVYLCPTMYDYSDLLY